MSGRVVFRADAAPEIGGGHVMRCLTLADALAADGMACAFAVRRGTVETVPALAASAHETGVLDGEPAAEPEALRARWPDGVDWLVVDHYGRDDAFVSACRPWAARILAVCDAPGRARDCDALLDQGIDRDETAYDGLVPTGSTVLAGAAYALLRPDFAARRASALARRRTGTAVQRIFVSFGTTDPANLTARALAALARADVGAAIDVVIGGAAPHLSTLKTAAANGANVRLHIDTTDGAALMEQADLAIGAAGVGALERCCLALPTLVAVAADNQRGNADALVAHGAALPFPAAADEAGNAAEAIAALAAGGAARAAMAKRAAALCDGLGARRTAMAILPERARDGATVRLRPADRADGEIMLAWQRHPATRRYANDPAAPTREGHFAWLERKLADTDCLFSIILDGESPAGVLRLDRCGGSDRTPGYRVSILVAPDRQRRGLGAAALRLARRLVPTAPIEAEVLPGNDASHALFRGAGYRWAGERALYVAEPEGAA